MRPEAIPRLSSSKVNVAVDLRAGGGNERHSGEAAAHHRGCRFGGSFVSADNCASDARQLNHTRDRDRASLRRFGLQPRATRRSSRERTHAPNRPRDSRRRNPHAPTRPSLRPSRCSRRRQTAHRTRSRCLDTSLERPCRSCIGHRPRELEKGGERGYRPSPSRLTVLRRSVDERGSTEPH